jgi:hypothetical protein
MNEDHVRLISISTAYFFSVLKKFIFRITLKYNAPKLRHSSQRQHGRIVSFAEYSCRAVCSTICSLLTIGKQDVWAYGDCNNLLTKSVLSTVRQLACV